MNTAEIIIYSNFISNRLRYVCNFIFKDFFTINYIVTNDIDKYKAFNGAKINYTKNTIDSNEIIIHPSGLLSKNGILDIEIKPFTHENEIAFFQTSNNASLPYDVLSCVFYMISRYEEYLPTIKDKHNRFDAHNTIAFKHGFMRKAVVDRWLLQLKNIVEKEFNSIIIKPKKFEYLSTIDIDNAYAFAHKGLLRSSFSLARDLVKLNFKKFLNRCKVLLNLTKDEFDTYDYLNKQNATLKNKPIYFFLVGKYGQYDTNLSLQNKSFQSLIKSIADNAIIGLHPSYKSNTTERYLLREKNNLEKITHREVTKSRQHFLKLNLPFTYRNLLKIDITEDYSMGFAQEPGFRAGTCTPFYFYDLDIEQETKLKIFPFQIMDGTLNDYMQLSINQALEVSKEIIDEIKNVNGLFVSLWHNESLSNKARWKNWRAVFEKTIEWAN